MENLIEQIQKLIDAELSIPRRDAAGIYTPRGIDSDIRVKALRECLGIVKDEPLHRGTVAID